MHKSDLNWRRFLLTGLAFLIFFPLVAQRCDDPIKIIILGSSTSYGNGASKSENSFVSHYTKFLKDSVNSQCDIVNLSFPGFTSYKVQPDGFRPPQKRASSKPDTSKNISKAIKSKPDAVIINLPTNDAESQFSIEETSANFLRITNLLEEANIHYWVTTAQPRNFDGNSNELKNKKKDLLKAFNTFVKHTYPSNNLDFFTILADSVGNIKPELNSGDGIHLNDSGHLLLSKILVSRNISHSICQGKKRLKQLVANNFIITNLPLKDNLLVYFEMGMSNNYSIEISDMYGKVIFYDEQRLQIPIEINSSTLPKGIYQLKIISNEKTVIILRLMK